MMTRNDIIRTKRKCIDMENLAEDTYIHSGLSWLDDADEVSDEENEEISRALESLTEEDLKIVRSEIIFI